MSTLCLAAAGWEAVLVPDRGGAIAALRFEDTDIFRPAPENARDPLDMACFPLVPYANRIAHGRFGWKGATHSLPRNFGDHPHCLHGLGWQRPWRIEESSGDGATLVHAHDGGRDLQAFSGVVHRHRQAAVDSIG